MKAPGRRDRGPPPAARSLCATKFEADGTTYSEYVLAQRLSQAYRLLANPRHAGGAISDIAQQCGFGDPAYFSRRFRRAYGAPPSELRATSLVGRDQTM